MTSDRTRITDAGKDLVDALVRLDTMAPGQ
jgi:hypothetical protein